MFFSLFLAGCGDQYRPVVTATNPVGPAAQPTKYAVAISSPTSTDPGLVTFVDVSGDEVITTPSIQNQPSYIALNAAGTLGFTINQAGTLDTFGSSSPENLITSDITVTTLPSGSVPVSITPVSVTGTTATVFVPEAGLDSVAALNSSGELVQNVSVAPAATPNYVVGSNGTPRVYALSSNGTAAGTASALESSGSAQIAVSASIPVGVDPVYGVMTQDDNRAFVLNQGSQSVSVIDVPTNSLDPGLTPGSGNSNVTTAGTLSIPTITDANGNDLSANPVWAAINPLTSELAVLSAGSGAGLTASDYQGTYSAAASYSLNNVVSYTLPSGATGMYVDTFNGTTPVGSLPTNTTYFSPLGGGAVTIFNIPLCNATAEPSNPNCNASNPSDSTSFGTVVGTPAAVGIAPTEIAILQDPVTPRAYVANTFDSTGTCTPGTGSVSVVNLTSGLVTATICGSADNADNLSQATLFGHPQTIAATYSEPVGKVYVTAPDSRYLSIIYTDTDSVVTHAPLQGSGVRVVVTAP